MGRGTCHEHEGELVSECDWAAFETDAGISFFMPVSLRWLVLPP